MKFGANVRPRFAEAIGAGALVPITGSLDETTGDVGADEDLAFPPRVLLRLRWFARILACIVTWLWVKT